MEPVSEPESEHLSRFDVFLLAEFEMLWEQRKVIREANHAEVTLFFAAVTAVGIAMGFVVRGQAGEISPSAYLGGFLICYLMAGIGVLTVQRLVGFHFRSVQYARGLNLIRDYFIDDENVAQRRAVVLETVPTEPRLRTGLTESNSGVVALVTAGIVGLGTFCLARSIDIDGTVLPVLVSIAMFAIVLTAILLYQARRLKRVDNEFFAGRESVEQAYQQLRGRARAERLYRRAWIDWSA